MTKIMTDTVLVMIAGWYMNCENAMIFLVTLKRKASEVSKVSEASEVSLICVIVPLNGDKKVYL